MAAQHVYRDGNEWGVTVSELIQAAVDEGRPVRLRWNAAGTEWDWPGNEFHTIVMPAVTNDLLGPRVNQRIRADAARAAGCLHRSTAPHRHRASRGGAAD